MPTRVRARPSARCGWRAARPCGTDCRYVEFLDTQLLDGGPRNGQAVPARAHTPADRRSWPGLSMGRRPGAPQMARSAPPRRAGEPPPLSGLAEITRRAAGACEPYHLDLGPLG